MEPSLIGRVWRKAGPCDWLRVVGESLDGDGLNGISVQFRSEKGRWRKERWFFPCKSRSEFVDAQRGNCRYEEATLPCEEDAS